MAAKRCTLRVAFASLMSGTKVHPTVLSKQAHSLRSHQTETKKPEGRTSCTQKDIVYGQSPTLHVAIWITADAFFGPSNVYGLSSTIGCTLVMSLLAIGICTIRRCAVEA